MMLVDEKPLFSAAEFDFSARFDGEDDDSGAPSMRKVLLDGAGELSLSGGSGCALVA